MTVVHTQAVLGSITALPRDVTINNFTFQVPGTPPTEAQYDAIEAALEDFYNADLAGPGLGVHNYIGKVMSRAANACSFRHYDITAHGSGDAAGSPVRITSWTLGAEQAGGKDWPEQVALGLSFRGNYGTDVEFGPGKTRPRSRRRGRVFLGPLNDLGYSQDATTGRVKPSNNMQLVWADAGRRLMNADVGWSVWSRVDVITWEDVVAGWVDDRFDTQRSRLEEASARTFF